MKLSELSIRHPILCSMSVVALILVGLIYLPRLPVREFPDVTPTVVKVTTIYRGASPEIIESQITNPLEEAFNAIPGVVEMSSKSREQASLITIKFAPSHNIDTAAQDVRDRVASTRGDLPNNIEGPTIEKQEADAQPMLWIAAFSDSYSTLELTSIIEKILKGPMQSLRGVSAVVLGGEKRFAIRLWLDSQKMSAKNVTVMDVENALRAQNIELPSGNIQGLQREFAIQTYGQLKTVAEYNNLALKQDKKKIVYLHDIGYAKAGVEDEHSIARYNAKPCVGLGIIKQSKANTIDVARAVKKQLKRLKEQLPDGVHVSIPYDESTYIESSINEVWVTLGVSMVLVILTIFFFLSRLRLTLIPAITIPVCLMATFAILSWMGFSINIVTMLGFVLAIGLVVDDSIVVLENIFRHIQLGMKPLAAAILGMKEIGFAVISTTLVLVVIFLPLAFQTSTTGRLFIEFAIVIAGSVLISGFVALTLSPMLAAYFLEKAEQKSAQYLVPSFQIIYLDIRSAYRRLLQWTLKRPMMVIATVNVVTILSIFLYFGLEHEFLPDEDKGRFLCIVLTPEGSSCEYTDRMVKKMEHMVAKVPEVDGYFTAVALPREGPGLCSEGLSYVRLKNHRDRNLGDILLGKEGLALKLYRDIEGAIVFPVLPISIGDSLTQPFQLVLENENLNNLNTYANQFSDQLSTAGFLEDVRSNFQLNKPQLNITINRRKAASLGVSAETISHTLQVLFGSMNISTVNLSGKQYKIIGQLERSNRLNPSDLDRIYVPTEQGQLVQLSNVVGYKITGGPNAIAHYNRHRCSVLEGSPLSVTLGTAIKKAKQMINKNLFEGFRYEWAGESRELIESGKEMLFILCLALLIVYMVLSSQFENLIDPFTIILTVPLAVFGALGSLWLLHLFGVPGMSINLFSEIGLVLLVGLVTKNGILLVEFANQLMTIHGKSVSDAIYYAALIRFRPIVMTAMASIAGALPIAIGFGMGAAGRRPLGIAVIGGMITSTFLTLFFIPTVYLLLARFKTKLAGPPSNPLGDQKAKILLLLIFVLPLVSGCTMGPKYRRPEVPIPTQWKNMGTSWKIASPKDKLPKGAWWKIFNDPFLDKLETQAIAKNQNLKMAFESLKEARAEAGLQDNVFIPDMNLNPSYTNLSKSIPAKYFQRVGNIEGYYSLPLDFAYEVDIWGRVKRSIESAKDMAAASLASFQSSLLSITSEVARDYFLLKDLKHEEALLTKIIQISKQANVITLERFDAGVIKSFDVKEEAIRLKMAQMALIDMALQENELQNALAVLCGEAPSNFIFSISAMMVTTPVVPPGIPSELLERRPDIAEAERQMAAANATIGSTEASFFPMFTIIGEAGMSSFRFRNLFDWRNHFATFGPDIMIPLNVKDFIEQHKIAVAKYNEAVANYKQKILVGFNEVEDALVNVHLNEEKKNLQKQIFEEQEANLAVLRSNFDNGIINYLEVLGPQRLALEAELKYSQIQNASILWTIQLIKAIGGGWSQESQRPS